MTTRELSAIAKRLMQTLPESAVSGPVIFKIRPGGILMGLHLGSSSRDGRIFRLNAFVLPLFVPTETIHFNYGKRIGSATGQWSADDPNLIEHLTESIRREAIPFLNTVSTLQGVAEFIRPMVVPNVNGYVNPHSQEALAYTLVQLNDVDGAMSILSQIQKSLSKSAVPWELAIRTRAQVIEEKLLPKPEAALAQLEAWKVETMSKLGLGKVL